ncbi:MAG: hypothetical protein K2X87_08055 [Gemmataceae bacterium]|nr:hypothetical protein [Gemmataceae bacterium]
MSDAVLVLHRGARQVTAEELAGVKPPPPDGRWHPLAHARVLDVVTRTLREAGYAVRRSQLGLTPDGHRFFGTLDLESELARGVTLAVGVRNSTDKTFPLGFCAGSRVFCCDNLAFRAELLVRKKHTLNGERNFVAAIAGSVTSLKSFRDAEADRIRRYAETPLSAELADALILRAYERGIVGARDLSRVLSEWRTPAHDEFRPRTAWSLVNAFTAALRDRAKARPAEFAAQTIRLNGMLDREGVALPLAPEPQTAA